MAAEAITRKADEGQAFWFLGGLYEVVVSADDTDGAMTTMRMTAPAGTSSPPHTHPGDEYLYVLDGEITVHIEDEAVELAPGCSCFFPAGTLEWFEAATEATVLVSYLPGGIEKFFAEVGEPALTRALPPASDAEPDLELIARAGARHGIEIQSGGRSGAG